MPTAFRAILAGAVSLTAIANPLHAHDSDGWLKDRRVHFEIGGGGSPHIPITTETFDFPRNAASTDPFPRPEIRAPHDPRT